MCSELEWAESRMSVRALLQGGRGMRIEFALIDQGQSTSGTNYRFAVRMNDGEASSDMQCLLWEREPLQAVECLRQMADAIEHFANPGARGRNEVLRERFRKQLEESAVCQHGFPIGTRCSKGCRAEIAGD